MMNIVRKGMLLAFLFISHVSMSQESFLIEGEILDNETGEPVISAHVGVKDGFIGTISNLDGKFVLKLPLAYKEDTLRISHVGYQQYKTPIATVKGDQVQVRLEPSATMLKEVKVTPLKPTEIILEAVKKIPANYPKNASMMKAFYRETIRDERELISLAEGIIDIYKSPYGPPEQDQMKLVKGRKAQDPVKIKILDNLTISGGLQVDFVKHGISFLYEQYFKYFNYELMEIVSDGEDRFYVIQFDPKRRKKGRAQLKGKIFIEVESMAFKAVEYELVSEAISKVDKKSSNEKADMKKTGVDVETLNSKTFVGYKKMGDKWYLHRAHSTYTVHVTRQKENMEGDVTYQSNLIITAIDNDNPTRFPKDQVLVTYGKDFGEQMDKVYVEDAWNNDNYLKLEEGAEKEIADFLRKHGNGK
ncbi:carboxypeptidase-like regulatory domain-containing protein [Fulvivirga sp. 29W222]|uniref:Carboxypeptidase-like regulatory domain-containing protein n=1 Tax=Fulvivirga marina TaxID=2494733 RepID=A0A937G2R1_9BACT|nr:carboxypeptidase-like regulatory domain-containing protein [Fulvivirga marina]MBL6449166.1 carboxypeptidase-like regulatory domain-containing protein [Fulvivirga marina]